MFRLKTFLFVIALCTLNFALCTTPTHAQETYQPVASGSANYQTIDPNTITPQSPQYANLMINNLIHSLSCIIIGSSSLGQPCIDYLNGVPVISSANTSGGLLGVMLSFNSLIIDNPPIRTKQYLTTVGESLGMVKEAHAQVGGSGAGVLQPVIDLWRTSRNIAYIAMIIIFVIIGLMVMFRQRINPQTVISVQAALPGLVIGLIMITFSYFLASLVTDIAYLATNLIGYYFTVAGATNNTAPLTQTVANTPATTLFSTLVNGIFGINALHQLPFGLSPAILGGVTTFYDSLTGLPKDIIDWLVRFGVFQLGSGIGGAIGGIAGPAAGLASPLTGGLLTVLTGPATGIIAVLISGGFGSAHILTLLLSFLGALMLLYTLIKLFIKLITNYLSIIFLTFTAPFYFLIASLPGRQEIGINWIRNMLCNVLAFPAVLAVFYFAAYLIGPQNTTVFNITHAQVIGDNTLPLFGGLNTDFIRILLAFGALLATPTIPDVVCRAIGKVGSFGQMLEQEYNQSRSQAGNFQGRLQGGLGSVTRYPGWRERQDIVSRYGITAPSGGWSGVIKRATGLVKP